MQTLLDQDEVPEEAQVARIMAQVLDGLVFLHSINVAHLDLKVSTGISHPYEVYHKNCVI